MMKTYGIIILITVILSALDILTGYIGAVIKKTVSSSKMRAGLLKKVVQIIVIAVAAILQYAQTLVDLGINVPILTLVCVVLMWMEVTSILENANTITGGKLSEVISKILSQKKDK